MKTKYDSELLGLMSIFEKSTKARLKDCFYNKNKLVFVVEFGEIRKALGKNKTNIPKLEQTFNRKIKIVEFNPDVLLFVKNLMFPLRIEQISMDQDIITIKGPDAKTKGLMIGARAQNLRNYEELTKKYFPQVKEIKVI